MKNSIFNMVAATLLCATVFTACQSPEEKVDAAKEDLKEANKELKAEAAKTATAAEWELFKSEAEVKIKENDVRIAELRVNMKKSGKMLDAAYAKRIDTLEQQNANLRAKIEGYEKTHSDWESFKREFNHDMDELGQAFKDIGVDNKN